MSRSRNLLRAGAVAAATTVALTGAAAAAQAKPHDSALFVQNANPSGNAIVAYGRDAGGGLHRAGTYPTGGLGGVLDGSVVDHLASQGSLAYDQAARQLVAVNAGSDTITTFAVKGDRLARRQVLASGGRFPVSVASHGDVVYVLNARDGGSIQGYRRTGSRLTAVPAWHRALGLDPAATPEFTTTPGQVAFTPDGRKLLVTTKGNTSAIDVFSVDARGGVSATPVVTSLPGAAPFAATFDAAGNLAVAEAGPNGVATFALGQDGALTQRSSLLTGQMASCWIVRIGDTLYVSNAGSGTLSVVHDTDGNLALQDTVPTGGGTVDAAPTADGRFLYVQTGATGGVDAFRVGAGGALTKLGSVAVPGAAGGEGIVAVG